MAPEALLKGMDTEIRFQVSERGQERIYRLCRSMTATRHMNL